MAFFGQKDIQQLTIIRRMVQDLEFNTEIRMVPIVRDFDGLAMSSRNTYLDSAQRTAALGLAEALHVAQQIQHQGVDAVRDGICRTLEGYPEIELDYLVLVDPDNLDEVCANHDGPALVVLAATVGHVRLLDNIELELTGTEIANSRSSISVSAPLQSVAVIETSEPVVPEPAAIPNPEPVAPPVPLDTPQAPSIATWSSIASPRSGTQFLTSVDPTRITPARIAPANLPSMPPASGAS